MESPLWHSEGLRCLQYQFTFDLVTSESASVPTAHPGTMRGRLTNQREPAVLRTHVRVCAFRARRPGLSVNEQPPRGAHAYRVRPSSDPTDPDMSDVEWCA